MRKIWLCDLDGTLAIMNGRGPFEWGRVDEDLPNIPVFAVVRALLRDAHEIMFISGRMEQCRVSTEDWLTGNLEVPYARFRLLMRKDDDFRPDEIVKRELYENEIAPHYDVQGIFDDRDKVVKMWRSLGLTCFQVADGNF